MKARTKKITEILKETYPDAECELNFETPFQLLVATILSAQTTDKKVNEVTESLFKDYPDVDSFLKITNEGIVMAVKMTARLIFLVAGTSVLTFTTSPIVVTLSLSILLRFSAYTASTSFLSSLR